MRRSLAIALTGVGLAAVLVAGAVPASAQDAAPTPVTAAEPTASPAAEQPDAELPEPTQPPATEPVPAPIEPVPTPQPPTAAKPAASKLPLREGAHGWRVTLLQDRLAWLGYDITASSRKAGKLGASTVAAVKKVQAKFGFRPTGVVGQGTWDLVADKAGKVGRLPATCRTGRVVCVDKTTRLVRLVVDGAVGTTMDARFGFAGAETREGMFRVTRKSRDHVSSLYRTAMPFSLFFSGGQAVHYSAYFARDGYRGGSHGCVNLRDYDGARWLFDRVSVGTPVYVYWS